MVGCHLRAGSPGHRMGVPIRAPIGVEVKKMADSVYGSVGASSGDPDRGRRLPVHFGAGAMTGAASS